MVKGIAALGEQSSNSDRVRYIYFCEYCLGEAHIKQWKKHGFHNDTIIMTAGDETNWLNKEMNINLAHCG